MFVVVKAHARFYDTELSDVAPSRLVDPIVAFFPVDHHYPNESRFIASVQLALDVVRGAGHPLGFGSQRSIRRGSVRLDRAGRRRIHNEPECPIGRIEECPRFGFYQGATVANTFVLVFRKRGSNGTFEAGDKCWGAQPLLFSR